MYKKILPSLVITMLMLSIQTGLACAESLYAAAPTDNAASTAPKEEGMFKKILQKMVTTTLHQAAQAGDVDKIRSLLAKGHDANGLDKNGATPLFWAAFVEDLEGARILVEHGADINYTNPVGATPLYNALHKRNTTFALWLLEQGANPLAVDVNGNTLLHLASLQGMEEAVAALLARGLDVNAKSAKGFSPLELYLLVQEQLSPGSLSASHIFRLLEAGAQYEPGPQTKKTLMDICLELAEPAALERELLACIQRTNNEKLRAYAQEMLAKLQKLPRKEVRGGTAVQSLHSSVLGPLAQDGSYALWRSEAIAIPLYNKEKIAVVYDFDPAKDPNFLAEADKAMAAFLKLDDAFRLSLSDRVGEYAQEYLGLTDFPGYEAKKEEPWVGLRDLSINEAWLKAFEQGKKPMEDVWRMVGNLSEIYVQRNTTDGLIYVAVCWHCLWDTEHGLQLSFKQGTSLARVGIGGDSLSD